MENCWKAFIGFAIPFAIPSDGENAHFKCSTPLNFKLSHPKHLQSAPELTGGPGGPGLPCGPSLP